MKENDIKPTDGEEVNSIIQDVMCIIMECPLDAEMDEKLGYSKYDCQNKDTDNSRNGYSQKTLHIDYDG